MYFRAGVNQVTFTVTIRDEGLVEPDEEFYIELEIPSAAANRGVVKASPDNATVIIRDDDGECCLKRCKANTSTLQTTYVYSRVGKGGFFFCDRGGET